MAEMVKSKANGGSAVSTPPPAREFLWEPFPTISNMRRLMDSFFDTTWVPRGAFGSFETMPQTNVYEKDGTYTIECALPGYKKDDVTVETKGNEVTITGKFAEEKAEEEKQYRRRELRRGSFTRTVDFPQEIDRERVTAVLENGLLKVEVHPLEKVEGKKVPVTGG